MISQHFAILGTLISFGGALNYLYLTIKGRVQPNRITWLLWSIAPFIGFAGQLAQHANLETSFITFSIGFAPLLIFTASFVNKKAYWKLTKFDIFCGIFSILALLLWLITGKGVIAIIFSMFSDFLAAIPTIVKSYKNPKSESSFAFWLGAIGALIVLLSIQTWNFANGSFPVYYLVMEILIAALISFPRPKKFR